MRLHELIPLVNKIVQRHEKPVLDASLRDIAEEINAATGYLPSVSVVKKALNQLGLYAKGHRWAYRHNPGKGE